MRKLFYIIIILFSSFSCRQPEKDQLGLQFKFPPDYTRPWVYWYWIDENISREGITRDLEAMARVGIGEALIGHISPGGQKGNVDMLSPEWWEMVTHAVKEGRRTGVDIGFFNGPGWAQSGGPWIGADEAMQYVVSRERRVRGPSSFLDSLPAGNPHFKGISLQAFRLPEGEDVDLTRKVAGIYSEPSLPGLNKLMDGNLSTIFLFAEGTERYDPFSIDIYLSMPIAIRSLSLIPIEEPFMVNVELQVPAEGNSFRTVRAFSFDRRRTTPSEGPMIFAPLTISFPVTASDHFKLVFSKLGNHWKAGFKEIELSTAARVDFFVEKQLGKMYPDPLPPWDAYLWPEQDETSPGFSIDPSRMIDLITMVNENGIIDWEVPEGEWILLHTGMIPTGVTNVPVPPQATGYDCDKTDKKVIRKHFKAYLGNFLEKIPPRERQSLKHIIIDSYEAGSQNWSPVFEKYFIERYKYDPKPWMPVFSGRIVGNVELSDRFFWDVRRLMADLIAENYAGGLQEVVHEHGLTLWLENYGHWGFPGEFLKYGGHADEVAGEFWIENPYWDLGSIECRAASSAAHIYGKPKAAAEAYTAGFNFRQTPASMKARGDWVFTEGINHTVLHVYIHQPSEELVPGVTAWFGMSFQRHNTWFELSSAWIGYLQRCHYMLQQGKHVADVCYFIGEDTPKMTGIREPELPDGYDYDYINAEVILERLNVENGLLTLPDGMSYRIMVLPPLETMRPEVLQKIRMLIAGGATVMGLPPRRSPSMAGYPECDDTIRNLAAEIWGDCNGESITETRFKDGCVFNGIPLEEAFARMGITPDLICVDSGIAWIHRRSEEAEIYFLSNQTDAEKTADVSFRINNRKPEFWYPDNGRIVKEITYTSRDDRMIVPVHLDPHGSLFVVFREKTFRKKKEYATPQLLTSFGITGPWEIMFPPDWDTPENVTFEQLISWTDHPNVGVRHFSGTAMYRKTFEIREDLIRENNTLILDLGEVQMLAEVMLNDQNLGIIWKKPYAVDVSEIIKPGENHLVVEVTNTWWNRLVGDERYPQGFPGSDYKGSRTSVTHKAWTAEDELLSSGLLGPVKVMVYNDDQE